MTGNKPQTLEAQRIPSSINMKKTKKPHLGKDKETEGSQRKKDKLAMEEQR